MVRYVGAMVLSGLLILAFGCSSRARIERHVGPPVRGRILGGDTSHIQVETEGGVQQIPRSQVADVHHPGVGFTVAGSLATAAGGALTGVWAILVKDGDPTGYGAAVLASAVAIDVAGLVLLIHGAVRYRRSRVRLRTPPRWQPGFVLLGPDGAAGTLVLRF